jgi:hypothetical protein
VHALRCRGEVGAGGRPPEGFKLFERGMGHVQRDWQKANKVILNIPLLFTDTEIYSGADPSTQ